MASSPTPARRLTLLSCILIGVAALLLPGCGDDSAATAEGGSETQPPHNTKPATKRSAAVAGCPATVDTLVKALDSLRHELAVGLSYEQYAARIKPLRHDYDQIPTDRLTLACVRTTGTPAEAALNKYIDAANAWGECLADASCTTATIEPVLQRKWRVASRALSEAR